MRRIIACLLLNSLLLFNARAQFGYEINPGGTTVTITNYEGPPAVVIPSTIDGLEITSIGPYAFAEAEITSVIIPYDVTNIGEAAFGGCDSLTNVNIPESVTTIAYGAFIGAGLTSLILPDSATNIGPFAFDGCPITNLTIPLSATSIESNEFSGSDLTNVTIPSGVTNIAFHAFESCWYLTSVFFAGDSPAVDSTAFLNQVRYGFEEHEISNYYTATAYYLPGTTGWPQFMSNTLIAATEGAPTNVFVPAMLWNPTIQATETNFGIQNGQYGFDVTASTNIPIAIEACDDLVQSNWIVLKRLALTNGLFHFSEPFQSNAPARFYRIGFP